MLIEVIDSSSTNDNTSKSRRKIISNNNNNNRSIAVAIVDNDENDYNDNSNDCNNNNQQQQIYIPTIPTLAVEERIVDNEDKNNNDNNSTNENEIQKLIYNTIHELYQTTTSSKHNEQTKHQYKYSLLDFIRSGNRSSNSSNSSNSISNNTINTNNTNNDDAVQKQLYIVQELLLAYTTKIRIDIFSSTTVSLTSDDVSSLNQCMSTKEQKIIQKIKQQVQVQNEILSIELLCTNYQILIEQAVTTILSVCTNNNTNNITDSTTTNNINNHSTITNLNMNSIYNMLHLLAHDISVLTSLLIVQLNKLILILHNNNTSNQERNDNDESDNNDTKNNNNESSIYLSIIQIINILSSLLRLMANTIQYIHIITTLSSCEIVPLSESSSLSIVLSRCICSLLILSEEQTQQQQQPIHHHDDTIQSSLKQQNECCTILLRQLMVLSNSSSTVTSANQQYQRLIFLFSNTQQQQQENSICRNDDTSNSSRRSSYPIFIQSLSNLSQNVVQYTIPSTTNNNTASSSSSVMDKNDNVTTTTATTATTIETPSMLDTTLQSQKEHNNNNTKSKSSSRRPSWTIPEPIIQHVFWPAIDNNESESTSNIVDDDDNNSNNEHNKNKELMNQCHFCNNDHFYDSLLSNNITTTTTTTTQCHKNEINCNNNTTTISNEWMTLQESIQLVWKNLCHTIVSQTSSHKTNKNNNTIVTVISDDRNNMKHDTISIDSSLLSLQSSIPENKKDEIQNDWMILFWKELEKQCQQNRQQQQSKTHSNKSRSTTCNNNDTNSNINNSKNNNNDNETLLVVTIDTISSAIRAHYFGRDDTIDILYCQYTHHYTGKKKKKNNDNRSSSTMLVGQGGTSIDKWIDNDDDNNGASVIEYIHLGRVISKKQHEQINSINETKNGTKSNVSDRSYDFESHKCCLYTTIRYVSYLSSLLSSSMSMLLTSTTTVVSELLPICYDLLSSSNDDDIGLGAAFIYHLLQVTYREHTTSSTSCTLLSSMTTEEVSSSLSSNSNKRTSISNSSTSTNRISYDIASNLITALYDRIKTCRVGRTLVFLGMAQCTLFRILIQQYEYNNTTTSNNVVATTTNDSTTKRQHDNTDQSLLLLLHEIKHKRRLATQQWILILDRNRTTNDHSLLLGILLGGIVPLLYAYCIDSNNPYDSLELGRSSLGATLPLIRCDNAVMDNIFYNASQQLKQCNRRLIEEIVETNETKMKRSTEVTDIVINSTMIYTTIRLVSIAALSNILVGSYPIMKRHGGKIISELLLCLERTKRYINNNNIDNNEELSQQNRNEIDIARKLQQKLLYHTEQVAFLSLKICGEKASTTLTNILKASDTQFYEKEFYTTIHQLLLLSTNNMPTTKCLP